MSRFGRSFPIHPLTRIFRLFTTITITKTIAGVARVQEIVSKTINGISRITATTTKTLTGLARVTESTHQTVTAKERIQEVAFRRYKQSKS